MGEDNFLFLGSGQSSLVWIWKISPKNVKFSIFFPSFQKKILLGRVKKYPGQRQISLLFTTGQKYARVGSGSIASFISVDKNIFRPQIAKNKKDLLYQDDNHLQHL